MPDYRDFLKQAIRNEVRSSADDDDNESDTPLHGLKICLNPGNGAGFFFQKVLEDLGADVSSSIHLEPDGNFKNGVPNPEYAPMFKETVEACQKGQVDLVSFWLYT